MDDRQSADDVWQTVSNQILLDDEHLAEVTLGPCWFSLEKLGHYSVSDNLGSFQTLWKLYGATVIRFLQELPYGVRWGGQNLTYFQQQMVP